MKKAFSLFSSKKNIALSVVAFILVMIIAVGGTYSWIEDISQVVISTADQSDNDAAQITGTYLKGAMNITNTDSQILIHRQDATTTINGNPVQHKKDGYFYESGDMHLSGCYGDGTSFYYPVKGQSYTDNNFKYREGTKDDIDVSMVSMSFKISSPTAPTSYWFDSAPTVTFTDSASNNAQRITLSSLVRYSITVDNETNVYSADGNYKTISNNTPTSQTGRDYDKYVFGDNSNTTTERGTNGNTLFTIDKGKTKEVTIKIWVEPGSGGTTLTEADLASINLNITSSWAKTRTITFQDNSVYGSDWFTQYQAQLYMYLYDYSTPGDPKYYTATKANSTYTISNVPMVYNDAHILFMRCSGTFGVAGDGKPVSTDPNLKYWDAWDTYLPDTFHNEEFTEFTPEFGTWKNPNDIKKVYFRDALGWGGSAHDSVYAYMWNNQALDTTGEHKAVQNHPWVDGAHGERMYYLTDGDMKGYYVVYYDANYNHVIFNNNYDRKTSDLWLNDGKVFDIMSDQWYPTNNLRIANKPTGFKVFGAFDSHWKNLYDLYTHNNETGAYASIWLQGNTNYAFIFQKPDGDNTKYWNNSGTYQSGNARFFDNPYSDFNNGWTTSECDKNHRYEDYHITIHTSKEGLYTFRFDTNNKQFLIAYPYNVNPKDDTNRYP